MHLFILYSFLSICHLSSPALLSAVLKYLLFYTLWTPLYSSSIYFQLKEFLELSFKLVLISPTVSVETGVTFGSQCFYLLL